MPTQNPAHLKTIYSLTDADGGQVLIGQEYRESETVKSTYQVSVKELGRFPFWTAGDDGTYRPKAGLWAPQRKAVALGLAYLAAQASEKKPARGDRESALIKMPTGTGKSGVIATLACCAPGVRRTIVLTPRKALVEQMIADLSTRFWKRFNYCFAEGELRRRDDIHADYLQQLEEGKRKSIHLLRSEGYAKIWNDRGTSRQIIVGTFNALHGLLGLEPPAHRSMYGRGVKPPSAMFGEIEDAGEDEEFDTSTISIDNFRSLLKETDLLVVDEGHYEPAYSWSQCVDEINAPTLLFTATPYRNDYKYFNLKGNFAFNLAADDAFENRLIREVVIADDPLSSAKLVRSRKSELSVFVESVRERVATYGVVPEGRPEKCIVHASTYERLKRLQYEFYRQDRTLRPVLIHDAHIRRNSRINGDLEKVSRAATDALGPLRFQHVREANRSTQGPNTQIWLHQFKLMEGIDNADFKDVFLYDGFSNARQLIQQVGRALRYSDPGRRRIERASIYGAGHPMNAKNGPETVHDVIKRQWAGYREYEAYVSSEPDRAFTAETQLLALLKKYAPDSQYIAGDFRKGFFTNDNADLSEYIVPRRAIVCHFEPGPLPDGEKPEPVNGETIDETYALNDLANRCAEAFRIEDRFDMRVAMPPKNRTGFEGVRVVRYLSWGSSSLLSTQAWPEWRLGLMTIVLAKPFVFIVDTEGLCIDFDRLKLYSPSPEEMKRLFSEKASDPSKDPVNRIRIVEAAATGLDVSDIATRYVLIRKRNLSGDYFDLAEASQAPSTLHGIALLGDETVRRRLSIRRGRLSDPTSKNISLKDYAEWARKVAAIMSDKTITPHPFFARFAEEVPPPKPPDGKAQNLLLDIWDLLNPEDPSFVDRKWDMDVARKLLDLDLCIEAASEEAEEEVLLEGAFGDEASPGGGPSHFMLGDYQVEVEYIRTNTVPAKGRYKLSCKALDEALISPREEPAETTEVDAFNRPQRFGKSLVALINQEQAFRVIPKEEGVVYANGVFFKPSIDWKIIGSGQEGDLLSIITPCPALGKTVSEKGEGAGVTPQTWATKSQFGFLHTAFNTLPTDEMDTLTQELAASDILVCDDGGSEVCDFFCVNTKTRTISMLHAKASGDKGGVSTPSVSVSNLQVVGRQASASLAFMGSSRSSLPTPTHWRNPLRIMTAGTKREHVHTLQRLQSKAGLPDEDVRRIIFTALKDPAYRREVWVVTSGLINRTEACDALKDAGRNRTALQFAYYLADLRTAFARAGVRLRIFCER